MTHSSLQLSKFIGQGIILGGIGVFLALSIAKPVLGQNTTQLTSTTDGLNEVRRNNNSREIAKLFDDDPALNRPIHLPQGICRPEKLLMAAGKTSRRVLRGVSPAIIYYAGVEGISVRAVMDAVAAVNDNGWRQDSPTEYTLIPSIDAENFFFQNISPEENAAYIAGEKFFQYFDQLPSERKQALFNPVSPDKMVNVRDLPGSMQDLLEQMVDSMNRDTDNKQAKQGIKTSRAVSVEEVHSAKIKIEPGNLANLRSYFIQLNGATGFTGFAIFLKQPPMRHEETDPESETQSLPIKEFPDNRLIYRPQDVNAREEKKKSRSFDRKVTLHGNGLTLNEALKLVHETCKVPVLGFVNSFEDCQKVTKDIRIENLPLRDALNQISMIYSDNHTRIAWYPGRYDVLIMRGFAPIPVTQTGLSVPSRLPTRTD